MFYRLIRRLQQLFRVEQEENEQPEAKRAHKSTVNTRQEEARILYQYPKQGKFRFPVIKDDEGTNKKHRQDHMTATPRDQKREAKVDQESAKKQKWFTNEQFQPTDIPSPVYGFQVREKITEKVKVQTLSEEAIAVESEPTEEVKRQEPIMTEKEEVTNRATTEIMDMNENVEEEQKAVAATIQIPEMTEISEQIILNEEEKVEIDSIVDVTKNARPNEANEVDKAQAGNDHVATDKQTTLEKREETTVKPTTMFKAEQENEIKEDVKEEGANNKQPPIPFNVMMLPQDHLKHRSNKEAKVNSETKISNNESKEAYMFPSIQLLDYPIVPAEDESAWLEEQGQLLEESLQSFHVDARVVHVTKGPSVTRFEIQPGRGVKVNKITGLIDDIKLALAAKDIRIEAPIPGKNTIGIEVPNRKPTPVFLREILRRDVFIKSDSTLTVALGLDISGQPIVTDLKKMPHGLVAGATGSGKSVCINSILLSLLYKATPDEVKLMLIDPKMVELAPYNGIPHLVTPVITDAKQATAALKWVVLEMERRYELFSQSGVRDLTRYNSLYSEGSKPALPYILVIIDELADLMMVSPQEVEESIARIAQKARACGIHLLLATQRPSVDVITGLIKANIPTRIAFSVSSQTDSRTILDMGGAERLLGRGDMLFHENGMAKPIRVQGTFVSDEEIENVIAHVKKQREPNYLLEMEQLKHVAIDSEADDEYFEEACYYVIEQGTASASSLQRRFRIGYNRAARLIDMMEERGIISQAMGSKPRHVLVDELELEERLYQKEE